MIEKVGNKIMKKMNPKNPSAKTKIFMEWIKEKEATGMSDKVALSRLFVNGGLGRYKTFQNAYSYLHYGYGYDNGKRGQNFVKSNPKTSTPKFVNKDVCYFYGTKDAEMHHISYTPEVIVYLSKEAHVKVHILLKQYHDKIMEKDSIITELQNKLNRLSHIIQGEK